MPSACRRVHYRLPNIRGTFSDEVCDSWPHKLIPTPGYWIECSRQAGGRDHQEEPPEGYRDGGIREVEEEESPTEDDPGRHSIQVSALSL